MKNRDIEREFAGLDAKAASRIPLIREDQRHMEAAKEVQELEAQLAKVKGQIENFSESTIQEQARQYLDGESDRKPETRQDLVHRSQVIEKAIEIKRENVRRTENTIVREKCELIKDIPRRYASETIAAFENLQKSLEIQELLYAYLKSRGFRQENRPACWQMTTVENRLLHGGYFGRLADYIKERKEVWGFKE